MELQQVQREAQQELEGPKDVSGKSDMLLSLQRFGPSDGTRWMFREETEAADLALSTGTEPIWPSVYSAVPLLRFPIENTKEHFVSWLRLLCQFPTG